MIKPFPVCEVTQLGRDAVGVCEQAAKVQLAMAKKDNGFIATESLALGVDGRTGKEARESRSPDPSLHQPHSSCSF